MRLPALLAAVALAAPGCGAPPPDLFEVTRSGADRNANVKVVVADNGFVRCNAGASKPIDGTGLLTARQLARDLQPHAELDIDLPPQPNSTLRYVVRMEDGRIAFSDTSKDRPAVFNRLVAFTKDVSERICGLDR